MIRERERKERMRETERGVDIRVLVTSFLLLLKKLHLFLSLVAKTTLLRVGDLSIKCHCHPVNTFHVNP